jgi:hypothetical protein
LASPDDGCSKSYHTWCQIQKPSFRNQEWCNEQTETSMNSLWLVERDVCEPWPWMPSVPCLNITHTWILPLGFVLLVFDCYGGACKDLVTDLVYSFKF